MKLIPASSAAWMIRIESSWSGLPQAPNIIAPRQSGLTSTPVRPSCRCSTTRRVALADVASVTSAEPAPPWGRAGFDITKTWKVLAVHAAPPTQLGAFYDRMAQPTR